MRRFGLWLGAVPIVLLGLFEVTSSATPKSYIQSTASTPPLIGSISCGAANRGGLYNAALLPDVGAGYLTPLPWRQRGYRYGSDELVNLIVRASAAIQTAYPGSQLGVADLSQKAGGSVPHHRSHQSGRDVDLLYYALDAAGGYMPPDEFMPIYRHDGRAIHAKAPTWAKPIPERYFDLQRNWAIIKYLISDPHVNVTHIFVSWRIRKWLLDFATARGESEVLRKKAAKVLHVPSGGVSSHNDHMHVRIGCTAEDILQGRCKNTQRKPRRGRKKFYGQVRCPRPASRGLATARR